MWVSLLLALAAPLVKRVLIALGIGVITYTVSTSILSILQTQIFNELASTSGIVLQMASLYGLPDFIGILLGSQATCLTLSTVKKFGIL